LVTNFKELEITFVGRNNAIIQNLKLLLDRKATVADLKKIITEKIQHDNNVTLGPIWIIELFNHRIHKIFDGNYFVSLINDSTDLIAEEIPSEELEDNDAKQIQVVHFCKDQQNIRLFGIPFYLYIMENETVKDIKERIQKKLEIRDEDYKRYKFAILAGLIKHEYLNDDDNFLEVYAKEPSYRLENVLGMEHKDPNPRITNNRWYDKPIVIKN
jgi:ubiquitin carboxyl-terminal hydrolase 7